jgi:hypothetical protein
MHRMEKCGYFGVKLGGTRSTHGAVKRYFLHWLLFLDCIYRIKSTNTNA